MKKPLILITGGQACDRQFRGKSYTLNKTYPAVVAAAGGLPTMALDPEFLEEYVALADGCICSGAQIFTPEYSLINRVDNMERNLSEQRIIKAFMAAGKPLLCICLGVQQLNVALGGTLKKHFRLEEGVEHQKVSHRVKTVPGTLVHRLFGDEFTVNSRHITRIDELAAGLKPAAWSPDGVLEAVEHESLPVYGFQWHPERMRGDFPEPPEGPNMEELFRVFIKMCAKNEDGEAKSE